MLYVSPISKAAMEAAYQARAMGGNVNLTCSVNHVCDRPYTGLTPHEFLNLQKDFVKLYPSKFGSPRIERDHLGKNGECFADWLEQDQYFGFDSVMMHVFKADDALLSTLSNFEQVYDFQIGPGEDDTQEIDIRLWAATEEFITSISFPTGCKINGLGNRSRFSKFHVRHMRDLCPKSVRVRGHNCDYLNWDDMAEVCSTCEDINIAPQIGVVQSCLYLTVALSNGFPIREWEEACVNDTKHISQWCSGPHEAILGCGHYHMDKLEWAPQVYDDVVSALARTMFNFTLVTGNK